MRIERNIVEGDSFDIVPFGDIHWGHANCDKGMVENVINFIRKTKCVWVGMGDYGDAIIPGDKRFDYNSIDMDFKTPQDQYRKIKDLFGPIADKCLGLLDGNHDILHWKTEANNYVLGLAEDINVPYLTIDAYLRFYFRKFRVNFDIYIHHGWTTSRTKGGVINRVGDLVAIYPYANMFWMGHVHQLGMDKQVGLYVDNELEIRDKLQWLVLTGSFLKGYVKGRVSYVEEKTYRPNVLGCPVLTVTPKVGRHHTSFNVDYKEIR